jgi:hypothetical protein
MDRVALGQVFSQYFGFPLPILIPPIALHSSPVIIGQIVADVSSGLSLTPLQEIIIKGTHSYRSRNSVVGIATSYGLYDRGWSSSPGRVKNFLYSTSSTSTLGSTQPPI